MAQKLILFKYLNYFTVFVSFFQFKFNAKNPLFWVKKNTQYS